MFGKALFEISHFDILSGYVVDGLVDFKVAHRQDLVIDETLLETPDHAAESIHGQLVARLGCQAQCVILK